MDSGQAQIANRALNKIAKVYRAVQARKLASIGLHPGQDVLIWELAQEAEGMTVTRLAARLGVEPPTATRSLARLESQELFIRKPVAGDRRQVKVVLTPRARKLVPDIQQVWTELAEEAFGELDDERRREVVAAMEAAVAKWVPTVDETVLAGEN